MCVLFESNVCSRKNWSDFNYPSFSGGKLLKEVKEFSDILRHVQFLLKIRYISYPCRQKIYTKADILNNQKQS